MVFEHIEKLKQEYTDKYVLVDEQQPELKRFQGQTGVVRTVNMNGRALVEFDANANIAWYDIDVDFLKIVDAPLPKDEPAAKATKPAAKKPAAKAAAKPAGGAQMSAADVLAAARGGAKAPAEAKSGSMSVADVLAAARGKTGASPAKPAAADKPAAPTAATAADPSKMSVADVLAAARGGQKTATPNPARLCPPLRTVSGNPISRAKSTVAATSSADSTLTMA